MQCLCHGEVTIIISLGQINTIQVSIQLGHQGFGSFPIALKDIPWLHMHLFLIAEIYPTRIPVMN